MSRKDKAIEDKDGKKNQKNEDKEKKWDRNFRILTLILTPIFAGLASGLVVHYQLSTGHEFWKRQHAIIQFEKHLDQQIKRIETISKLLNDLINMYAKSNRDSLTLIISSYVTPRDAISADVFKHQFKSIQTNLEKYEIMKSEFASVLQTNCFLFFEKEVSLLNDKLMVELSHARLGSALNQNEVISEIGRLKSKGKTEVEITNIIMEKYLIKGDLKEPFAETCRHLLAAMYREIGWKVK